MLKNCLKISTVYRPTKLTMLTIVRWFRHLKTAESGGKNGPSKWKNHARVRYADCKGSYVCENDDCFYKKHYGMQNNTQFDKDSKCKACGHSGKYIPCTVRRYISYGKTRVKVFHCGVHQCPVYTKTSGQSIAKIKVLITNNPNITPSQVQSSVILSAF